LSALNLWWAHRSKSLLFQASFLVASALSSMESDDMRLELIVVTF